MAKDSFLLWGLFIIRVLCVKEVQILNFLAEHHTLILYDMLIM